MVFIHCGHISTCEGCSKKYEDYKYILCRKEFSIFYKSSKILYQGEWKDSKYNGGKLYDEDSELIHEGEFKDSNYNGYGSYYDDGILLYEGEFKDSNYNGYGSYYDDGILLYEGEFKDGEYIKPKIKDDELCLICMTEKKNMAFIPCGHLCICEGCSKKYEGNKCILCRKEFYISYKILF